MHVLKDITERSLVFPINLTTRVPPLPLGAPPPDKNLGPETGVTPSPERTWNQRPRKEPGTRGHGVSLERQTWLKTLSFYILGLQAENIRLTTKKSNVVCDSKNRNVNGDRHVTVMTLGHHLRTKIRDLLNPLLLNCKEYVGLLNAFFLLFQTT